MGLLIQTQRWADRKPLGPQEIDWAHPLTRGLRFFLLMGERAGPPRDLVSGAFLGSNFDWVLDDEGVGINQAATLEATTPFVPTAFPFTINARWRPYFASTVLSSEDAGFVSSSTARKITFSGKNKAADTNEYRLFLGGTEAVLVHGNSDPVSSLAVVDTTGISRASNDHLLYWGQDAPITSTTDAGTNLNLNRFRIRGAAASSTWYHFGCWDRALTADEVAWLHTEPYALLRPRRRRLFYVVAGGAISGSAVLSGTGVITAAARKGALIGTAITARPGLGAAASKGARMAGVLGAAGTLSVLGRAARLAVLTVAGGGVTAITGSSARRATVVVSAGGSLIVSGSTLSGALLEGRVLLTGLHAPTQPLAGTGEPQVALNGEAAPNVPLVGRLS